MDLVAEVVKRRVNIWGFYGSKDLQPIFSGLSVRYLKGFLVTTRWISATSDWTEVSGVSVVASSLGVVFICTIVMPAPLSCSAPRSFRRLVEWPHRWQMAQIWSKNCQHQQVICPGLLSILSLIHVGYKYLTNIMKNNIWHRVAKQFVGIVELYILCW